MWRLSDYNYLTLYAIGRTVLKQCQASREIFFPVTDNLNRVLAQT